VRGDPQALPEDADHHFFRPRPRLRPAAGMLAGANAYIVKPDTSEIVPTVKRLLEQARAANFQPLSVERCK
jgi:hypothetical protein